MLKPVSTSRFHGRHEARGRPCHWPACEEAGEFRAPGTQPAGFDGPGEYRWFCLDHVRAFNSGYDYFEGMSAEEILDAQSPMSGWERETRAFRPDVGIDSTPRWADFSDPLDAIGARARKFRRNVETANQPQSRKDGKSLTWEERRALDTMELHIDADRRALRTRYAELVRRYHPDHNGGDRRTERKLQKIVDAYQLLRKATVFK